MNQFQANESTVIPGQDRPSRPLEDAANSISQLIGRVETLCGQMKPMLVNLMGEKEVVVAENERPAGPSGLSATTGHGDIARIQSEIRNIEERLSALEGLTGDMQRVIG